MILSLKSWLSRFALSTTSKVPMVQDHDLVAKVQRQLHNMGGKDDDASLLELAQQLLHLLGHHHV